MAMNWFCSVTEGGKGFVRNRAEERRYKDSLFRRADKEIAEVVEYACCEGKLFFVLSCQNVETVRRIVKTTNASYGKYKKFLGEEISFDPIIPVLVKRESEYNKIKQQFFNTFYVAEGSQTVV